MSTEFAARQRKIKMFIHLKKGDLFINTENVDEIKFDSKDKKITFLFSNNNKLTIDDDDQELFTRLKKLLTMDSIEA